MDPQTVIASATSGSGMAKFLVSGIAGAVGMYYLAVGKKEAEVQKMIIGGILIVVSMVLF